MSIFPELNIRFNTNSNQIPVGFFFLKNRQADAKMYVEIQRTQKTQNNSAKEDQSWWNYTPRFQDL